MIVLHTVSADIVVYICHVLYAAGLCIREAGSTQTGSRALPAHIGVTESSYDHVVLDSGGVGLHQVRSRFEVVKSVAGIES